METTVEVKERPILFSGEMVRAILEGRKTQTRRVIKARPSDYGFLMTESVSRDPRSRWPMGIDEHESFTEYLRCPYGKPGDRLWVREAWNITQNDWLAPGESVGKSAADCARDNRGFACPCADGIVYAADGITEHPEYGQARWRPSIHMFRWASRIHLEVTGVRVERVQEISEEDAISEGINPEYRNYIYSPAHTPRGVVIDEFRKLWDSINAKRGFGWDANPWVWVIDFNRITP